MHELATLCKQLHALPMADREASFDGDSEIEVEQCGHSS
jgi:hypothetical protein